MTNTTETLKTANANIKFFAALLDLQIHAYCSKDSSDLEKLLQSIDIISMNLKQIKDALTN